MLFKNLLVLIMYAKVLFHNNNKPFLYYLHTLSPAFLFLIMTKMCLEYQTSSLGHLLMKFTRLINILKSKTRIHLNLALKLSWHQICIPPFKILLIIMSTLKDYPYHKNRSKLVMGFIV